MLKLSPRLNLQCLAFQSFTMIGHLRYLAGPKYAPAIMWIRAEGKFPDLYFTYTLYRRSSCPKKLLESLVTIVPSHVI